MVRKRKFFRSQLDFPYSISVCEPFQCLTFWPSKRIFESPRILMQENSFRPTLEWHTKPILFSPFFINFVRAPHLWSFQTQFESWQQGDYEQRSMYMADQTPSHSWGQASPPTPSSLLDSSHTASYSPGLPSASVNASYYIPRGSSHLLASVSLDVSNILGMLHLYHVLKNYSTAAAIFFVTEFDLSSLWELPSSQHGALSKIRANSCLCITASLLNDVRFHQN